MKNDWWDEYQAELDAEFAANPKKLELYMSKEDADKIRAEDAEPPHDFHEQIMRFLDKHKDAQRRLTILEDDRCALVCYQKNELVVIKCLAIAGSDEDVWYGIDYFGKEHAIPRERMFP